MGKPGPTRRALAIELGVCFVLVALISMNALRRMDYLGGDAEHIRMTDVSRTAYVAKNIVEGRGYTTNDLPAALVDFYDQKGKLHEEEWVNADRFPFAAYATAALYGVTQSTSWEVGILGYNLIFFLAFLILLYRTAQTFWDDRYAGVFAVGLALLHPYTFQFLYWKDGDMLFLATACMAMLYRYYQLPSGTLSRRFAIGLGTLLAFVFLARPNLGLAFILFLGVSVLMRLWASRKVEGGLVPAIKHHLQRELLVLITIVLWCLPFVIHSMSEWGQPLFSANSMYQLPLGTRYGMGTDTWWKYTEPGTPVTLGHLASNDTALLLSKFTSSWLATIKNILTSYPFELVLSCGFFVWLGRRPGDEAARHRPLRIVGYVMAFALVSNLAVLPLYSFQDYSFRHYLAFALPLMWLACGRAISLLVSYLRPTAQVIRAHVRDHLRWYVGALLLAMLAWNLGVNTAPDAVRMSARTSRFVATHWLGTLVVFAIVIAHRWILRPPWLPRIALVVFMMVHSCYRPSRYMKAASLAWFPTNEAVWTSLQARDGLVSSFALQSEVAWNTGRKNIPAPELPMHVYSFLFDHELEVEDVYIESAAALVLNGPFTVAAPGFEGYVRLQQYPTLPGYEVAFHEESVKGFPKYKIKPREKASTVFRLVDRAAIAALRKSPDRIELGDERNVIYTAHGWEDYTTLDGKRVVAATNATRRRYPTGWTDAPWEDSSITFFVDERRPRAVELEVYAPQAATYQFYWNLDLFAYDHAHDRKAHAVGALTTVAPGWNTVRLEIPAHLLRTGINKLGFRASAFRAVVLCPAALEDDFCLSRSAIDGSTNDKDASGSTIVLRPAGLTEMEFALASLFVGTLSFQY